MTNTRKQLVILVGLTCYGMRGIQGHNLKIGEKYEGVVIPAFSKEIAQEFEIAEEDNVECISINGWHIHPADYRVIHTYPLPTTDHFPNKEET